MDSRWKHYGTFFSNDYEIRCDNTLKTVLLKKIEHYISDLSLLQKWFMPNEKERAGEYIKIIRGFNEIDLASTVLEHLKASEKDRPLEMSSDFCQMLTEALCEYFGVTPREINALSAGPCRNGVAASPFANTTLLAIEQHKQTVYKALEGKIRNRELSPLSEVVNLRMHRLSGSGE